MLIEELNDVVKKLSNEKSAGSLKLKSADSLKLKTADSLKLKTADPSLYSG